MTRLTTSTDGSTHTYDDARPLGGLLLAAALCLGMLLTLGSSPAAAAEPEAFCVDAINASACPADAERRATLAAAVDDAPKSRITRIYLPSGTYKSATTFDLDQKPIRLIGVGPTKPLLTVSPLASGKSVLSTTSSLAQIENLEIYLQNGSDMIGIETGGGGQAIRDVVVSGPGARNSRGIVLTGSNPSVSDTLVELDGASGESTGISISNATSPSISDTVVRNAGEGIALDTVHNFTIRRSQMMTGVGLAVRSSDGTISSSLIESPGSVAPKAVEVAAERSGSVNIYNCTLIRRTPGSGKAIKVTSGGQDVAAEVKVESSVISGYGDGVVDARASATSSTHVTLSHTWFDGPRYSNQWMNSTVEFDSTSQPNTPDYGFINRAAGDYRLRISSPLIDAGNPDPAAFNQAESDTDLAGLPRIVNRGAGRIRDVGAYELQNHAPVPQILVLTSNPSTTSPTIFTAGGSTDADGDPLSFDWVFDALPGPGGTVVSKQFLTPGPHVVRLTATDITGSSTTIQHQFMVELGHLAVKLRAQTVKISSSGVFKVTVSCPSTATSDCIGRLLLQTPQKVDANRYIKGKKKSKKKSKPVRIKAANELFRIAPGETKKLSMQAVKVFRQILAATKRFKLTGSLTNGMTDSARLTSNRATFTIKAPTPKKKSKRR